MLSLVQSWQHEQTQILPAAVNNNTPCDRAIYQSIQIAASTLILVQEKQYTDR